MDIRTHLDGETMYVALEGRLDAAWSRTVGKSLQETLLAGCHRVVLDLGQVSYLSSAGIRVLMLLAKQLKGIDGSLRIGSESAPVREVLEMVGFHRLLEPMQAAPVTAHAASPAQQAWQWGEQAFEVYALEPEARQQGTLIGQPAPWLAGGAANGQTTVLRMTPGVVALGLGALGGQAPPERIGELLAVHGLAIALPGDDPAHPDWLAQEGAMVPEISLLYGLCAAGAFRYLLRFAA